MRSLVPCFASFFAVGAVALATACATAVVDDPKAGAAGTEPDAAQSVPTGGKRSCTKTACANGAIALCTTTDKDGQCTKADYEHDGQVFACASCDDCADAEQNAKDACNGTTSSSGSSGSSGTESCSPLSTTCVSGGSMSSCQTKTTSGTCTSARYTYAGQSYACAGCSDCNSAYYAAYTACQGATGACSALASCCTTISSTYTTSCQNTVSTYQGQPGGDVSCNSTLKSYRSSGLCP